jgi:FlaA1/EpsC-like NDP-sugar epimerase
MTGEVIRRNVEESFMFDKLNLLLKNRYLPRWVIFTFDVFIVISAFLLSYNLRYNFASSQLNTIDEFRQLIPLLVVYIAGFVIFRPFSGIIRHTTSHDIQRIFSLVLCCSLLLVAVTLASRNIFHSAVLNLPISVIIIHMMVTASLLTLSRIIVKYIYHFVSSIKQNRIPVMIYGAGDLGQAAMLAMERSSAPAYYIVGFIDTNRSMQGKRKSGLTIYSPGEAVSKVLSNNKVKEVVVAISPNKITKNAEDKLFSFCLQEKIELRKVPPIKEWLDGRFEARQIRKIVIEDLLGRKEIKLDTERIQEGLNERVILVTGAAGSIGSELVRQLFSFKTGKIILLDQAESALYDLQMELHTRYNGSRDFELVIADISNYQRLNKIFELYRPDIIFNASAYKHVPLLEDNVCEAVRVNIGGTKLLADLAVKHKVEKFVMISSDKAVNPTNVMGASKRICEMYVQSLVAANGTDTQFITTRFGNVLGSSGSVVPLFTRQIESGGPITLTHMDVRRYFMTIPEACQLVLEAGFMGQGGEIFLFDMGEPVKIYDLAVKMISLAGLEHGKDIKIIETGLRPGEKLFEEVLASKEHNLPTHHPKILIANMRKTDPIQVKQQVDEILCALMVDTEKELVEKIKKLVPEFEPQNPKFRNVKKEGVDLNGLSD